MRAGIALLFINALAFSLAAANSAVTVVTAAGAIRGSLSAEGDVASFFNVPYAEAPIDALRFAAPVPKQSWNATLDCSTPPSFLHDSCPEFHIVDRVFIGREDCLMLNVYAPWPVPSNAPVMIFIPGGGFVVGSGYHHGLYDGSQLARQHGAVVVVMQYRLGILGWGALRSSVQASASAAVGNYGLMDQRLALWWAHANAAAFGGSPGNMMVFGQSAGAVSVCMHAANPSSLPPLAGLAIESGMCDSQAWLSLPDQTISFTRALLNHTDCGDLDAVGDEGRRVLACIRSLPLATVLNHMLMYPPPPIDLRSVSPDAASALPPLLPIMGFAPTLDGSASGVTLSPVAAASAGSAMRVPYIIGTNQDEGSLFVLGLPLLVPGAKLPPSDSDVLRAMQRFFPRNASAIPAIVAMYANESSNTNALAAIIRDMMFTCPQRRFSRALAASGYTVHTYRFLPTLHTLLGQPFGDYHCSELPFVFLKADAAGHGASDTAAAAAIERLMGSAWVGLAAGRPPVSPWLPYDISSAYASIMIDGSSNTRLVHDLGADVCALWDTVPF